MELRETTSAGISCNHDTELFKLQMNLLCYKSSSLALTHSRFSLCCYSVQQGPMRDCGVQIPRQKRRLRLGGDTSHPDPLLQAAEADLRRLCQLHPKVGPAITRPLRLGIPLFLPHGVWCLFVSLGVPLAKKNILLFSGSLLILQRIFFRWYMELEETR